MEGMYRLISLVHSFYNEYIFSTYVEMWYLHFCYLKKLVEERQRKSNERSSQVVKMTLWEPHGGQLSGRRDNVQRIGSVKVPVCNSLTSEHFHVSHPSLKEVFLCLFPPTETTFLLWTHVKIMTYCQPHGIYLKKGGPEGAATFLPSTLESWSRCGCTTVGIFCST